MMRVDAEPLEDDLGLDVSQAVDWFQHQQEIPYVLIRVDTAVAQTWRTVLGVSVRRCYVTDALLDDRAAALGRPKSEILSATLPDAGPIMSGDFGEILVYLYHAAKEYPTIAFGPKKWRLKQARTKSAPYSDVIHFVLPSWPIASEDDLLICSEVKTKSTARSFNPISDAIAGSAKDRTSRLSQTLVWLRDRALIEDLGEVRITHLDRFIKSDEQPAATKRFCAVAVVSSTLLEAELVNAPTQESTEYRLVVIAVPDLREIYTSVFEAVRQSVEVNENLEGSSV